MHLGQVPNQSIPNLLGFPNPSGVVLHHCLIQSQGDLQHDWRKESRIDCVREFVRDRIMEFLQQQPKVNEWGSKIYAAHLENQLFIQATSKEEYMNQETLNYRVQILIRHAWCDANYINPVDHRLSFTLSDISIMNPSIGISNSSCSTNSPDPPVDHSMTTCTYNNYQSDGFLLGPLHDGCDQGLASFACGGNNMLSPMSRFQLSSQASHHQLKPCFSGQVDLMSPSMCQNMSPSYGFLNEAVNVGSAFIGSNVPHVDGAAAESESCLNLSSCVNHESQQQHLDPHIQYQLIPGHEVNALRSLDVGSNLTMNHPDLQPSLKKSPSWLLLSSLQISQQLPQIMHENFDFLPKKNDQTPNLSPEILLQSQQLMQKVQQFQQCPHEPYVQLDQPYEVHFCDLGGQAHGRLDNDEALQLKVPGQYQLSESHTIHQQFMDQEPSISEPLVQNDSHLQIAGEDIYQQPPLPSEESIGVQDITSERSAVLCGSNGAALSWNITGDSEYYKVHRFLLLYIQYMHNSISEENCKDFEKMGQFLKHHLKWNGDQCKCFIYHRMLWHYQNCYYVDCPMCGPVRRFDVSCPFDLGLRRSKNGSQMTANDGDDGSPIGDATEDIEPPMKRLKMEHSYLPSLSKNIESQVLAPSIDQPQATQVLMQMHQGLDAGISVTSEVADVDLTNISEIRDGDPADSHKVMPNCDPVSSTEFSISSTQADIQAQSKFDQVKQETEHENFAPAANHISGTKLGNLKIKAVSLIELFTPEQIKEHIRSLRQWVGQSKANAEKNHAMEYPMNENSCQLCMMEKLSFEIPPIYCSVCGACIKRNMTYYTALDGIMRYCFCASCYSESRAQSITVDGLNVHKATLLKKKNDEENDESWVQCDKCQGWQHQICALYNAKRDEGGNAEYICPYCYLKEIESGEHIPLADRNLLGAKDLPRTKLSDHIEDRLFNHLKQEREERAKIMGKNFDEVPGAEALFVRVVLSVNKILEVKQHFRETFQEEKYPEEFPYRSKVILLFQKIEGVEVCLFGMCVQEFGSECSYPNQRCVYLSYLDSVKYFRPNIKTVTGEALRTFVYHEILIGYLDYCKKRGFSSCHIWACPPLRGDDYILYCHPEIQKMPKSDKLREWYLAILKKAAKENIVVNVTNLYDHFFVPAGECKAKITATRLPYFDGDYWPGAAEDMINYFNQKVGEEKLQRKGKNSVSRRTLKAMRRSDISGNAAKDILLMKKLGETIYPMKEDFLMVSLQFVCTHCSEVIASGRRWVCNICEKFQLCEKCHDAEQNLDEKNKHPIKSRKKHVLAQVEVIDVPLDTEDREEILDNELFENRNTFLSFCQGKHYQFDTLRRAKHSSMMILYYLHNPTAAAVFATCNICHNDIEVGEDWNCMVCPEFRVCDACYHQKECGGVHIHKLTRHSSMVNHKGQSKMTQTKSTSQIRQLLDVLVHASHCCQGPVNPCPYQLCSTFKKFFCHTKICKTRMARGCKHCKKIWFLLQLHSRNCIQLECPVPRCMDLKKLAKNRELQSDTRRRDGVTKLVKTAGS